MASELLKLTSINISMYTLKPVSFNSSKKMYKTQTNPLCKHSELRHFQTSQTPHNIANTRFRQTMHLCISSKLEDDSARQHGTTSSIVVPDFNCNYVAAAATARHQEMHRSIRLKEMAHTHMHVCFVWHFP